MTEEKRVRRRRKGTQAIFCYPDSLSFSTGTWKLGRDQNQDEFSVSMAGGGIQGGTVYGIDRRIWNQGPVESNKLPRPLRRHGVRPASRPEKLIYRYSGGDLGLTYVH